MPLIIIFISVIFIISFIIINIIINQNETNLSNNIITDFPSQIKEDVALYEAKFGKIHEYYTSYSVVQNSKNYPFKFKYICKYFDLPVGNDLKIMLENKLIDNQQVNEVENLRHKIVNETKAFLIGHGVQSYNISFLLRKLCIIHNERVVFNRTIIENDLLEIYRFISGQHYADIILNNENIRSFIEYIDMQVNSFNSVKDERAKMSPQLRAQVLARDNYTCQECGASIYDEPNLLLEVDHILPVSKGGKTIIDNLQTLCWKCNRQKSNK